MNTEQLKESKVVFGLMAQGHIETIESMLAEYGNGLGTWHKIANKIGWDALTCCYHYLEYKMNQSKSLIQPEQGIDIQSITDFSPYLLLHKNQEMVRASCLHYLGDKFQEFDQQLKTKSEQVEKVGEEMSEADYKLWAEEQVREGVAMIYNYTDPPKTWEQCYKEFAEKEVIRHNRLWRKFLELNQSLNSDKELTKGQR